jgi:hypothetical protein
MRLRIAAIAAVYIIKYVIMPAMSEKIEIITLLEYNMHMGMINPG